MEQATPTLKYGEHWLRLRTIQFLMGFVMRSVQKPGGPEQWLEKGYRQLLQSVSPQRQKVDVTEIINALDQSLLVGDSRNMLYSLNLVMLVTLVEIFIEHLVDVILTAEPRRLKDLAADKNLTANELVDLTDYASVMKRLREKVSKQVVDSRPCDMFLKHLGKRFGLFREDQFVCKFPEPARGISEIEAIWDKRHKIVHEGRLSLDLDFLDSAFSLCTWLETFLSIQAHFIYGITVDIPQLLNAFGKQYKILTVPIENIIAVD